jgi:hypothetical protein
MMEIDPIVGKHIDVRARADRVSRSDAAAERKIREALLAGKHRQSTSALGHEWLNG